MIERWMTFNRKWSCLLVVESELRGFWSFGDMEDRGFLLWKLSKKLMRFKRINV